MTAIVTQGNARALHAPDESVDLIVTSPPYFALRSYTDGGEHYGGQIGAEATPQEYIASLIECSREWMRVLKPGGSIWVNLGDKYSGAGRGNHDSDRLNNTPEFRAARLRTLDRRQHVGKGIIPAKSLMLLPERYRIACVDELGLIARAVVVWSKPNGLPESVTDRVRRSHEDWVHLTKQPRYFAAVDEIREAYAPATASRYVLGYQQNGRSQAGQQSTPSVPLGVADLATNPLGKLPGSVWTIPTQPLRVPAELGISHFAAFPMEWPRRIILGWSPEGGTVLDPFGGTGTTALVASVLGRVGISVDMSADYCRLARWRTTDPKQLARARRGSAVKAT